MRRKPWTPEMDEELVALLKEYDMDFKRVQQHFSSKTVNALQKRFRKIDPSVKSGNWDDQENIDLLKWIFDDAVMRVDGSLALFDSRRKLDVESRILYFKNLLIDRLFPDQKQNPKLEAIKKNVGSRKSKRAIKHERKCLKDEDTDEDLKKEKHADQFGNALDRLKDFTNDVKDENITKSLSNKCDSGEYKSQTLLQFITTNNLEDQNAYEWSQSETDQLLELHNALGENWSSMSKFLEGREII